MLRNNIKNHLSFILLTFYVFSLFLEKVTWGAGPFNAAGGGGGAFGAGLIDYEGAVKSGVTDQLINIDYSDEIYTDKKLNARLLYILDMMGSKPAKTSIVRGFDKTLQEDIIYSANSVGPDPGVTANADYTVTLQSADMKNQIQEQTAFEFDFVPASGYTNYGYVKQTSGKAGTTTQLIITPIDPTLIFGPGSGSGVPANTLMNATGTWFGQGTGSVAPLSFWPTVVENYVQVQKTPYELAFEMKKERLLTKGTAESMMNEDAKREHLLLKEKTLLFNGPAYKKGISQSTDTLQIGYMGGMFYNIKTYSTNTVHYDTWSYDVFDQWQYNLFDVEFDDEVGKRLLVCNKAFRKFFTDLKKDKPGIDWAPNGTYGIPGIRTVVTDNGEFDVMVHPRVDKRFPSPSRPVGMALYLPYIELKPQTPTMLTTNIQANDVRTMKNEFYSAWTYLMHQPIRHGLIY